MKQSVKKQEIKEQRKGLYSAFFPMYIALVLQNVVTISVNLADNIMLGSYSETALSGVAAVNQIQFVYQQLLMAFGDGMVIFCSQYWGKKQIEPMKKIAAGAMRFGIGLAAVLFIAMSLLPGQAVGLFTYDQAIIAEGVKYLNIIRFTYPFFAVTVLLLATLRSVETVKIAFYLSIMTFFVNCGINYVLIYGHFGAPQMGTAGAAVGTLTARILEVMVLICYICFHEKHLKMTWKDYLHVDRSVTKDYLKITTPMLIVQGLWGMNTALQTVVLGHMNAAAIAANSVASTLFLVVKSTGVGAASATSVIIGKTIGLGDMKLVKRYAKQLQKIFVVIGITFGIVLFFIRIPILNLYQLAPDTRAMANTFLMILSVVYVGTAYQMPVNNGIIRGGGTTEYVLVLDLVSIWCIVIPLSFLMAFVVKASPVVVVCCLNADQLFKCIPSFFKVNFGKWAKILTKETVNG